MNQTFFRYAGIVSIAGMLFSSALFAQSMRPVQGRELPELVTDRPDYTEATDVAGTGIFQFEQGFTIERDKSTYSFTGPELLMRVGVGKRFEFRFGGDGVDASWGGGQRLTRGTADSEVGAKIMLSGERHYMPAFSLLPMISLPTGHHLFSSGGYDPTVKLAWSKSLPWKFDVGGNFNVSSLSTPEGRFLQTATSVSFGHDLAAGFGGYWEVFGFSPIDKDSASAWIANTGLTHGIGRNAQLDVRVGRRITAEGPDVFFGFGLAFRRPTGLFARNQ